MLQHRLMKNNYIEGGQNVVGAGTTLSQFLSFNQEPSYQEQKVLRKSMPTVKPFSEVERGALSQPGSGRKPSL
jgi:hypothetical protein